MVEEQNEKKEENKDEDKKEDERERQLRECEKLRDEYLAGWQRAKADFLNYKKDELERFVRQREFAEEEMFLRFLEIFEDLEKVKDNPDKRGADCIFEKIKKMLNDYGIEEIKAQNENFDPALHEAIETAEGENPGKIIEVLQKGYKICGRVLKPARVKVVK